MKSNKLFPSARRTRRLLPAASGAMILAFAALSLAACTQDDGAEGTLLPEGMYPMTFSTAVEGLTVTRANTAEGQWTAGDEVAVQVGDEVKKYTPAADGTPVTLQAADAANPFYWQKTTETVSAWYCGTGAYNEAQPRTWSVQPDQSDGGYQQSDFLYAPATEIPFADRNSATLKFYHQTAKVIINILKAKAATDAGQIQSVVIGNNNNIALSGAYAAPSNGQTAGTWSDRNGTGTVIPKNITPASGYLKSYAALLIPQQMQGKQFIRITLGGNDYFYTPAGQDDADLTGGQQYTYDITVTRNGLHVTAVGATAWTGTETGVTSKELEPGYSASDLKIGDYYYSDGTWSDGGYRKYADGTTALLPVRPVLTGAGGNPRTVIGIVYSTEEERIGAAATQALQDKGVMNPHGLVMALTNASEGCRWGNLNLDENSNGNDGEPFKENTDQLAKQYRNVDGYAETQWIINAYNNDGTTLQNTYSAFYHASRYGTAEDGTAQYAAPANTTGWFIPSMGQWWDILSNLGGIDLSSYRSLSDGSKSISGAAPIAISNMNTYLNKISGATQFKEGTYFLSSSEYSSSFACNVLFNSNGYLTLNYYYKDSSFIKVRFSLAF